MVSFAALLPSKILKNSRGVISKKGRVSQKNKTTCISPPTLSNLQGKKRSPMKDQDIMQALQNGDEHIFKQVFYEYYDALYRSAYQFVGNVQVAEEIVQDAFVNFWNNRGRIIVTVSIQSYLYGSVKNLCLNYLNSKYARNKRREAPPVVLEISSRDEDPSDLKELELLIRKSIEQLPERCRIIFNLSRTQGMTYQEIANELDISKETVKSQIKIALKKLQGALQEHWYLILVLLWME